MLPTFVGSAPWREKEGYPVGWVRASCRCFGLANRLESGFGALVPSRNASPDGSGRCPVSTEGRFNTDDWLRRSSTLGSAYAWYA